MTAAVMLCQEKINIKSGMTEGRARLQDVARAPHAVGGEVRDPDGLRQALGDAVAQALHEGVIEGAVDQEACAGDIVV